MYKCMKIDETGSYRDFKEALAWDNYHYFSKSDDYDLTKMFSTFALVYYNDIFTGYGVITKYPTEDDVILSYIVNPDYRRQKIATSLLDFMIRYCQKYVDASTVTAKVLKENSAGIAFIESSGFDLAQEELDKVIYQKKLIKPLENGILK